MNLENLNLVELNAQEVQEVDGGDWCVNALTKLALIVRFPVNEGPKITLGIAAGLVDGLMSGLK